MRITLLVGNPKPESRTLRVCQLLARQLAPVDSTAMATIDLATHTSELFAWPSPVMTALMDQVASSELLLVASPTYKATYTGLLKSFLDRYPKDGLAGVTAVPIMTGADLTHAMAPDMHLRPLLVELGARVPSRALYFVTAHMNRAEALVADWVLEQAPALGLDAVPAATMTRELQRA